ncbi:MAG: alpha/beta fold hydrolase [Streptosporangiales bacterium]|nr:alpha/beta fold hydrolase [Streptosporangiales bacterium]
MATVQLYARDVGHGTPLVLLHAFPLSQAMWLAAREGLTARCRVITPDLRGFGGSPLGAEEPSMDAMADDVAALLDDKGIERAVVGGHSMGGYVTMAFARRHPGRLLGVVLAGTKASADPAPARRIREAMAERALADGPAVLVDEVLPGLVGPSTRSRRALIFGRVRGLVQSAPPSAVAWAQRAMAGRPDSFDTLRGLGCPALVIAGEEDTLATVDEARAMADALPDARLVVVGQSGHLAAIERPEEFNEAVGEFVARCSPASA